MKISQIQINNFQALTGIDIIPAAPILLIAGSNAQGKSSIHDAIRMAISGESSRVKLKKEYGQLVRDGATAGNVCISFADGRMAAFTLPDGKLVYSGGTEEVLSAEAISLHSACLPMTIDPYKFSGLSDNDKRTFLFKLSGLKCDGKAVSARMLSRGCDPKKTDAITSILRSGFSAAHDEAKEKAKNTKAMWKGITGETYGEKKAEAWKADAPVLDPKHMDEAKAELNAINMALELAQKELGALESSNAAAIRAKARREELQVSIEKKDRIQKKLSVDKAEQANWSMQVEETKKLVSGARPVAPLACPHCAGLIQLTHGVLVQYEEPEVKHDAEAAAKLPVYEKALALITSAVSNGERDLKAVELAEAEIAVLEKTESPDDGAIMSVTVRVDTAKARRKELHDELDTLKTKQAQADSAKEKTEKAATYHADTKAWEIIAAAMAPDGIPGEMLADALKPFNNRLRETSIATGWDQAQIDPEMSVRVGGRVFNLLSESDQWKANASIAESISHISGLKFICFDRCDVLDIESRSAFFKWLHRLTQDGQIDTACCFGTFKAVPGVPKSTFDARWIERGEIIQQQEAA